MKDRNLVIIYYDGVLGDTSYSQSYNNFRMRHGSISGLRKLYAWSQVVIVMPYVTKRAKVIATYLEKHQGCPVDAIYTMRQKQLGKTKDKWFRYQQIFEDFDIEDEEKIITNVIIIGSYIKEVFDKNQFNRDFKEKVNYNFGFEPSLQQSKLSNILLEGCSGLSIRQDLNIGPANKVNPIAILLPHLRLETNNCNFSQVSKQIEAIKMFHIQQSKNNDLSFDKSKRKDSGSKTANTSHYLNKSMQSTSIEQSDTTSKRKNHSKSKKAGLDFAKLNFLELFYQIQEQKQHKLPQAGNFKSILTIESKELQAHIFKHEIIEEYLKEKSDKRKYTIVQKRYKALTDIENPQPASFDEMYPQISSMFSYQSMFGANESLNNNYILQYRKSYLGQAMNCTAEEIMNISPITDQQMLQKTTLSDLPIPQINYFASHRFFLIKGFQTCQGPQMNQNQTNHVNNGNNSLNLYEYVDVQREMGEFLPNDIQAIINNQSQFDVQDWLCKKMFARPMNQIISKKKGNNVNNGINQ